MQSQPLLVVVPARGGSKRLPRKNLRLLCGKSLLEHTADAIVGASIDAPVILSTDDDDIASEGKRLGWSVPFRRPAAHATDDASTIDVILHAMDFYREGTGFDPEQIMVLQPTSPLRGSACLRIAVQWLNSHKEFDAVIGMAELGLPPTRLFFVGKDGATEPVSVDSRSPVYAPNGAIYLARTRAVRAARSLYTSRLAPLVMDAVRSIDIDTELDWRLAESAISAGLLSNVAPAFGRPSSATQFV
jgi:CMP-N-acetylneuraminic acid synthetase